HHADFNLTLHRPIQHIDMLMHHLISPAAFFIDHLVACCDTGIHWSEILALHSHPDDPVFLLATPFDFGLVRHPLHTFFNFGAGVKAGHVDEGLLCIDIYIDRGDILQADGPDILAL